MASSTARTCSPRPASRQTPTTLAELQTAVDKLKAAGIQPIALGAKDAWPAAFYYYFFALRECSSTTLTETAKTLSFDDACWLKAGQDVQNFAATKPFNNDFLTTSAQQGAGSSAGLLANHKAAMELMGAWNPGVIASLTPDQKPLPDLDWFPFPSIDGGAGEPGAILGGVDGYSCSVKAPKAECAAFLNYIAKTDVQEAYYKAFDAPPVNSEAQKAVTEPYLKSVLAAYNKAPFVSQWLDTVYGQNVGNALNTAVVNLLAGKGRPPGHRQRGQDRRQEGLENPTLMSSSDHESVQLAESPPADRRRSRAARLSRSPPPRSPGTQGPQRHRVARPAGDRADDGADAARVRLLRHPPHCRGGVLRLLQLAGLRPAPGLRRPSQLRAHLPGRHFPSTRCSTMPSSSCCRW